MFEGLVYLLHSLSCRHKLSGTTNLSELQGNSPNRLHAILAKEAFEQHWPTRHTPTVSPGKMTVSNPPVVVCAFTLRNRLGAGERNSRNCIKEFSFTPGSLAAGHEAAGHEAARARVWVGLSDIGDAPMRLEYY